MHMMATVGLADSLLQLVAAGIADSEALEGLLLTSAAIGPRPDHRTLMVTKTSIEVSEGLYIQGQRTRRARDLILKRLQKGKGIGEEGNHIAKKMSKVYPLWPGW